MCVRQWAVGDDEGDGRGTDQQEAAHGLLAEDLRDAQGLAIRTPTEGSSRTHPSG